MANNLEIIFQIFGINHVLIIFINQYSFQFRMFRKIVHSPVKTKNEKCCTQPIRLNVRFFIDDGNPNAKSLAQDFRCEG